MAVELLTKEDLHQFKTELLSDIRKLFQDHSPPTKKWLKSYEVREMLGISKGTLQHMNNRILFPSQIGGLMFYEYNEILKLMESTKKKRPR